MKKFRQETPDFGSKALVECLDYAKGLDGLPKSDVLKFILADHCSVVVVSYTHLRHGGGRDGRTVPSVRRSGGSCGESQGRSVTTENRTRKKQQSSGKGSRHKLSLIHI